MAGRRGRRRHWAEGGEEGLWAVRLARLLLGLLLRLLGLGLLWLLLRLLLLRLLLLRLLLLCLRIGALAPPPLHAAAAPLCGVWQPCWWGRRLLHGRPRLTGKWAGWRGPPLAPARHHDAQAGQLLHHRQVMPPSSWRRALASLLPAPLPSNPALARLHMCMCETLRAACALLLLLQLRRRLLLQRRLLQVWLG